MKDARHTSVLDHNGLLGLLRHARGRRLLGVVDGFGCVELVFDDPRRRGDNLVTIMTAGPNRGLVYLGSIARELIDGGYCDEDAA